MPRHRSVRRRVSQADVARAAGVSTGIVSSVINNKSYGSIRVSEATRQRVLAAVEELGYVPNLAARSMAGGTNGIIGVFTYESVFPMGAQSFYHEFLVGIEEAADEAAHSLLLVTGARREERRSLYVGGTNALRLADGGLLLGTREDTAEILRLAREQYPFVFVGERHFPGLEPSFTAADYLGGTAALVQHVHEVGHQRIALLCSHDDPYPGRIAGFRRGQELVGGGDADFPVVQCPAEPAKLERQATALLDELLERRVTAVVGHGRGLLSPLWAEAERRGLDLPGDLSFVGLGGNADELAGRPVTELLVPRHEMGSRAVGLLLQLIADPSVGPLQERLPCSIRPGETLVPPS